MNPAAGGPGNWGLVATADWSPRMDRYPVGLSQSGAALLETVTSSSATAIAVCVAHPEGIMRCVPFDALTALALSCAPPLLDRRGGSGTLAPP